MPKQNPSAGNGGGAPISGGRAQVESFSYRGSEMRPAERRAVSAQNMAAKSGMSKNLDRVDSGAKAAETRMNNQLAKEDYAHSVGMAKGKIIGGAAGIAAGVAADELARAAASKPKGTQADHHVTDSDNHTRPLPKDQQAIVDVAQRLGSADKKSK
jgi:hypothetical protein